MESTLSPELERLKIQLDDFVLARGWSLDGYYFDESPFEGVHLVKDGGLWKLYWKHPSIFFVERKFVNLSDAFEEMLNVVTTLKQNESPQHLESIPPDDKDIEMSNIPDEDKSIDENITFWDHFTSRLSLFISMLPIIFIAILLIAIVLSWISSSFSR